MKPSLALSLLALPLLLTACATPRPPQVFHNTDDSALIVASLDSRTARQILPTPTDKIESVEVLNYAKNLAQHQTAVVILENYSEAEVGALFRDRSTPWFIGLRGLGYQHILFLQGNGSANPDGLIALAEYD
jgi:hypothetical protein